MSNNFVHFRVKSSFSMLESCITIDSLIEKISIDNMDAICLADRYNLASALEFSTKCLKKGIKPIHGLILNILFINNDIASKEHFAEILLVAQSQDGFKNMLKLLSIHSAKSLLNTNYITIEDLIQYSQGVILLSAYDKGIAGNLLLKNEFEKAFAIFSRLKSVFHDRIYCEITRTNEEHEKRIENNYITLANKLNLPLIATNNILFSSPEHHEPCEILNCISSGSPLAAINRKKVSEQCYIKNQDEMNQLFSDIPSAISNSYYLSQRCNFFVQSQQVVLPHFLEDKESEEKQFRREALEGLQNRLKVKYDLENIQHTDEIEKKYHARLNYELDVICGMKFAGYFLIVSDFIRWGKRNNIAVGPGRGSGAGSIVAWCLDITDLDPIAFGLLFERFLNPDRVSMPDFDIDFCQKKREEVIKYVKDKYHFNHVGHIATFGKLQAKAVIKDVARVVGLPYVIADRLTELVPFNAINPVTLQQAIDDVTELKKAFEGNGLQNLDEFQELIQKVLQISLSLEGLHRHSSIHAAGIVISNQPLHEIVPVFFNTESSMLTVQYDKKDCELAGLIKFDFLGLQTLTLINDCVQVLQKDNIILNLEKLDYHDKKTFDILSKGHSNGVFQFESLGIQNVLKSLKPDKLQDIIALGALYRPGPMDNIPTYIKCKNGKQDIDYLHPSLKDLLRETYGVVIYQEQVMEIAKILANYTLAQADLLRKAMGKKNKMEMKEQEFYFIEGAKKNGIDAKNAEHIFDTLAKFAGYGFNKAHASAYGVISYRTAYLKANFTPEFIMCAMNLDIQNSDKISVFIYDAKLFKIPVIAPCINKSNGLFSILCDPVTEEKSILFALGAIKGVSVECGNQIFIECHNNGPFKDIIDFIKRIPHRFINKKTLDSLIKSGAFDNLHKDISQLIYNVEHLVKFAHSYYQDRSSKQLNMLNMKANESSDQDVLGEMLRNDHCILSTIETSYLQFDVIGFFINKHPLSFLKEIIERTNAKDMQYVNNLPDGKHSVILYGIIIKKDSRMSRRGRFINITLSDLQDIFQVTIFAEDVLTQYSELIKVKNEVVVSCEIEKLNDTLRIIAYKVENFSDFIVSTFDQLVIDCNMKEKNHLDELLLFLQKRIIDETDTNLSGVIQPMLLMRLMYGYICKINLKQKIKMNIRDIYHLRHIMQDKIDLK